MKIRIVANGKINSCSDGIFNYFGWPTVGKLADGTLMAVCSGFRTWHVDPFGKVVAFYSRDEGETWTPPTIICDTPLDDRDAGFLCLNDGRVMITSFNNTISFQTMAVDLNFKNTPRYDFIKSYLAQVDKAQERKFIGSFYKLSPDGYIFNDNIIKVPVSSPHGPIQLKNGIIFYAGTVFHQYEDSVNNDIGFITSMDGVHWSEITRFDTSNINNGTIYLCEPCSVQLDNGKILVLFRANSGKLYDISMELFYTCSEDNGVTFSPLKKIDNFFHGGPPHLLLHSSDVLICAYGYRKKPYGQRVMLSNDNGENWQTDFVLRDDGCSWDLGYPSSVELSDGKILTVYYQGTNNKTSILQYTIWELEK